MSAALTRRSKGLPLLAFTCGDPAGIGPEAVVGALGAARRFCRPLLVGEEAVWRRAGWRPGTFPLFDTALGLKAPPYGKTTREAGLISFAALKLAAKLAGRRLVSGLVTAPISKLAWHKAGVPYRDHTEYFKAELRPKNVQMILGAPDKRLWCVLATRHVPLKEVSASLSVERISAAARGLKAGLASLGLRKPRVGLCGFNPHAGEDGLLGSEERRVLAPAARRLGLLGPLPADTAWRRHAGGKLDGLVCLYHDQALIPLKVAAGLGVVNWTVGLPFIRTSPGHGTGFDIAGKGGIDSSATLAAARLAAALMEPNKKPSQRRVF